MRQRQLQNAYIGEYWEWKPNDNTLLYLPLESDAVDKSGKSVSTTASNVTYGAIGGVTCVNANGTSCKIQVTTSNIVSGTTEGTCSMLLYYTGTLSEYRMALNFNRYGSYGLAITVNNGWSVWGNGGTATQSTPGANQWVHIAYTVNSSGTVMYMNGVKVSEGAKTSTNVRGDGSNDNPGNQFILCSRGGNSRYWKGGAREVIIENKARTEAEMSKYYQYITSKLGIS